MPAESRAQLKAMAAAASGQSTLGIPAKVGREYVEATSSAKGLPEKVGDTGGRKKPLSPKMRAAMKALRARREKAKQEQR